MTQTQDTLSIREMCNAFQVTARTLRFYESKELLHPIRDGTKRHFTRKDRARLTLILRGKRFGFSLEEIRQLLEMYEHDGSNKAQLTRTIQIGRKHLAQMQAQRAELDLAITDLQTQLNEGERLLSAFSKSIPE
jgi:DNA-binding transcriptional MerR regulator